MAHVAFESMLRPFVRLFMHPCPGNRVAIGRAVLYYARTAHAYSAGIKCRHCMSSYKPLHYVLMLLFIKILLQFRVSICLLHLHFKD